MITLVSGQSNIIVEWEIILTLLMLRLSLDNTSKPCLIGIHWQALAEYSQMSTHMPGFQSFFSYFEYFFELAKLAPAAKGLIKINHTLLTYLDYPACSHTPYVLLHLGESRNRLTLISLDFSFFHI